MIGFGYKKKCCSQVRKAHKFINSNQGFLNDMRDNIKI